MNKEQTEQLNNLLADNVMTNIDHISAILRDGKTPEEMDGIFAAEEAAFLQRIQEIIGEEALANYKDYTRDLLGSITAQQFQPMLTGDTATKEAKTKQLDQILRQETQQTLARAGLSPDFQLIPTLNFRNFVSEDEEKRNLQLMDEVYSNVASQAGSFLDPDELKKFEEFRAKAITNNKMILAMNRKLMSPQQAP